MDSLDQKLADGSSEKWFTLLNIPVDVIDKIKIFLSTHPLPQWVIRTFHNIGL